MVSGTIFDHDDRLRSFELLAQVARELQPVRSVALAAS
jgi:hypothetical protein